MDDARTQQDTENQANFLTTEGSQPVSLEEVEEDEITVLQIISNAESPNISASGTPAPYEDRNCVAGTVDFAIGDLVQGKYKDGAWYNAEVVDTAGDKFVIRWTAGIHDDTEKAVNELRVRPPFKNGDLVRARRQDGFLCNASIVGEYGSREDCKYVVEWEHGEIATINDATDVESLYDQARGSGVGFKIGDRVTAPRKEKESLDQGRIVRIEGDLFVIEWEGESSGDFGMEPAKNLTHQHPPVHPAKIDVDKPSPAPWMPPVSSNSNAMDTDETPAAAQHNTTKTLKSIILIVLGTILLLGCIAGWCVWIAIPVQYIRVGRHTVRDTWNVVNCTVVRQSCWKQCGGCNCPDSCCTSAEDCVRSSYFMSQTCVWLSQSKYEQNRTDFTAKVNVRDDVASASRPSISVLLAAAVAMGYAILVGKRGHATLLFAALALSGALLAQGGCDCTWTHEVSMTVTYNGLVVTKEMACSKIDGRSFCATEFQYRDRSCGTLEEMEKNEYCQEPFLSRVGRSRECFINPEDPSELEISGTKGIGAGHIISMVLWGVFTVFIIMGCIIVGCGKRCGRGGNDGLCTGHIDCSLLCICI